MKLKVLGSSSNGNCYIIETDTGNLILDCGINYGDIKKALKFNLLNVCGCLVTHSHKDHTKGLEKLANAGVNIYASKGTLDEVGFKSHRTIRIADGDTFKVDDFLVLAFKTEHDTSEPLGFLIQYIPTCEKLLFATDTFYLRYKFLNLDYIMIECNYIRDILDSNVVLGKVHEAMKDRIIKTHFSLHNVKEFLKASDLERCNKIVLIHLSEVNSDSRRMVKEITELTGIETVIASKGMEIKLGCPF